MTSPNASIMTRAGQHPQVQSEHIEPSKAGSSSEAAPVRFPSFPKAFSTQLTTGFEVVRLVLFRLVSACFLSQNTIHSTSPILFMQSAEHVFVCLFHPAATHGPRPKKRGKTCPYAWKLVENLALLLFYSRPRGERPPSVDNAQG